MHFTKKSAFVVIPLRTQIHMAKQEIAGADNKLGHNIAYLDLAL
jgi:hypothetical protein